MEIKEKVDRYAELVAKLSKVKTELEELKGFFEARAINDLRDTKLKTASYWGSSNSKISVSNSETVKVLAHKTLRDFFGNIYTDYITEKTTYDMNASCKRLLGMAFLGNYTEGSIDKTIEQITADDKIRNTLRKKLQGKYERDKAILMNIAGLAEGEASDWAYLVEEAINWGKLIQVLKASGWKDTVQEAVDHIKSTITVEEGIKVTFEAE